VTAPRPVPVTGTFWQATQPVSGPLTDAQLRASAVPVTGATPNTWTWVGSVSTSVAPAANAILADTGALAVGSYDFDVTAAVSDTVAVGKGIWLEHRNAANNANLRTFGVATPNGGTAHYRIERYALAASERMRCIVLVAGAASSRYAAVIGSRIWVAT